MVYSNHETLHPNDFFEKWFEELKKYNSSHIATP